MLMRKPYVCLLLLLFCALSLSAEGWHVCVSSFRQKANAEHTLITIQGYGEKAYISEATVNDNRVYRVLLEKAYDDIAAARSARDGASRAAFAVQLGLSGFWVCKGEPMSEPAALPAVPTAVQTLQKNQQTENQFSAEKPYSVLIQTYKEENAAQRDKKRLQEHDIDAYVVKRFDDRELFSFDLHSGAFETPEQAASQQQKLSDAGITTTTIADYEKLKDAVQKYDEVVTSETVVFDNGVQNIPQMLPASVQKLVQYFPVHTAFQIEEIAILDADAYRAAASDSSFVTVPLESFAADEAVHAVSSVSYVDALFGKTVFVQMAEADKNPFTVPAAPPILRVPYATESGVFSCAVYQEKVGYTVYGENPDQQLYLALQSDTFSPEDFTVFLQGNPDEKTLLVYPQLRKTLFTLPDERKTIPRAFLYFTLEKVQESYASERHYTEWAVQIVGHWVARSVFEQQGDRLSVSFFDLDYDYNAKKNQQLFMAEKDEHARSDRNHPLSVRGTDGWYLTTFSTNELTFSVKSYSMSVDSRPNSSLAEPELLQFAEDLKIWN